MSSSRVLVALWLVLLGGCVGSFLNVVIYRLPRGMSLIHPGSQCPHCSHAIRWYHNLPVVGWLIIGGRCHDCGGVISSRYPVIEAIVAGMFLALAWRGPLATTTAASADASQAVSSIGLSAWAWYGYYQVFLCGLLVLAIMEIDAAATPKMAVPWPAVGGLVVFGLLAPAGWSGIAATTAGEGTPSWASTSGPLATAGRHLAGVGVAGLLALAVWSGTASRSPSGGRRPLFAVASLAVAGGFLGPLSVGVLGAVASAGHLLAAGIAQVFAPRHPPPWSLLLWALALAGLLLWGPTIDRPAIGLWQQMFVAMGLVVVTGVLSLLRRFPRSDLATRE